MTLSDEEAFTLRINMPGTPKHAIPSQRDVHRELMRRGLLREEVTDMGDGTESVHMVTTPAGESALARAALGAAK